MALWYSTRIPLSLVRPRCFSERELIKAAGVLLLKHTCGFSFRYPNPQFFLKKFKPQSLDFVVCLVEISGIEPLTS